MSKALWRARTKTRAAQGKRLITRLALWAGVAAASLSAPLMSGANPTGGQVSSGKATITGQGSSTVTVNQSTQRGVINWTTFSNTAGEKIIFNQPNAAAVTLNRVTGSQVSTLMGALSANGQVYLINPNGILFGKGSTVNAAGLVASTAGLSDQAFMKGGTKFAFQTPGLDTASIINQGTISISNSGIAAFVGPQVINSGVIEAHYGQIALAAGRTFTLDLAGDGLISFAPSDAVVATGVNGALVQAGGSIVAESGSVLLTAQTARQVVNQSVAVTGLVSAAQASVGANGVVHFGRAPRQSMAKAMTPPQAGTVTISGTGDVAVTATAKIDASAQNGLGGQVSVTGANVDVQGGVITANGSTGGGQVLIGGGARGQGALAHATTTTVAQGASITADATQKGDGGHVVLWSDQATEFAGAISANGGAQGGDGGLIETSSKVNLDVPGTVSAKALAASGKGGQWLLDPADITITSTDSGMSESGTPWVATGASGSVSVANIQAALNAGTSVDIETSGGGTGGTGNITVASSIAKTAGGAATLTLGADNNIVFNSGVSITSTSGALNMAFTAANGQITAPGANTFTSNGGNITFTANGLPVSGTSSTNNYGFIAMTNGTYNSNGGNISITSANNQIYLNNAVLTSNGGNVNITANNPPPASTTSSFISDGYNAAAISLVNGFSLNVGTGAGQITGSQPNQLNTERNWNPTTGQYTSGNNRQSNGVAISGTVNLTATTGTGTNPPVGSIAVNGTGSFGILAGWYNNQGMVLTSSGNVTFTGTGTGLVPGAHALGMWYVNATNNAGTLTFNGIAGSLPGAYQTDGLRNETLTQNQSQFTNNGSANLVLEGSINGSNNSGYTAAFLQGLGITNNSTGNVLVQATRNVTTYGTQGIYLINTALANTSSGNFTIIGVNNTNVLNGRDVNTYGDTITNSGSGTFTIQNQYNGSMTSFVNCCDWSVQVGSGGGGATTINNTGSGDVVLTATGPTHQLLLGGTFTNSGTGSFTVSASNTNTVNGGIQAIQMQTLATNGQFTINGTSTLGWGIVTNGTIANNGGSLTLNGTGAQGGVLLGNGSYQAVVLQNNDSNGGTFTVNGKNTSTNGNNGGVWLYGLDTLASVGNVTLNGSETAPGGGAVVFDRPFGISASGGTLTIIGTNGGSGAGLLFNTNGTSGANFAGITTGSQITLTTSGTINMSGTSVSGLGVQTNSTTYLINTGNLTIQGTSTGGYGVGLGWGGGTQSLTNQGANATLNISGTSTNSYGLLFNGNQNFYFTGTMNLSGYSTNSSAVYMPYYNGAYGYYFTNATATGNPTVTISGSRSNPASTGTYDIYTNSSSPNLFGDGNSNLVLLGDRQQYNAASFLGFSSLTFAPGDTTNGFYVVGTTPTFSANTTLTPTVPFAANGVTFGSTAETGNTTLNLPFATTGSGNVIINAGAGALALQGKITAPNATILIEGGSSITANSGIITSALGVDAANATAISINSALDQIGTFAATTAASTVSLQDGVALTLGSVAVPGYNALGGVTDTNATSAVTITSSAGISITRAVNTNSTTANALVMIANLGAAAGSTTGGNITVTSTGSISIGTGATAKLYSSSLAASNGLSAFGAAGGFRYDSTSAVSNYTRALAAGINIIYSQQPTIDSQLVSANGTTSSVYNGIATTPTLAAATAVGANLPVNSDHPVLTGTVIGAPALDVGTYNYTGSNVTSDLGYKVNAPATMTYTITKALLTISGLTANNLVYNAGTADTISGTPVLAGYVTADKNLVSVGGTAVGAFADPNVGTAKTVTVTGLTLGGAKAIDYSLTFPTLSANITQAPLTVSGLGAQTKTYDGTNAATLTNLDQMALNGLMTVDQSRVSLTGTPAGTFINSNAGVQSVAVTGLSLAGGSYAANYQLIQPTITNVTILQKALSVGGLSVLARTYDGATDASVLGTPSLSGVIASDSGQVLLLGTPQGAFASPTAGNSIQVNVSNISLTGSKSTNYTLNPTVLTGTITPLQVQVTGYTGTNKVYDGTLADTIGGSPTLQGVLPADANQVNVVGTPVGTFSTRNTGANLAVSVSRIALGGNDAVDYALVLPTVQANITPFALQVSGLTANNKVYDGSTNDQLSGFPSLVGVFSIDAGNVNLTGTSVGTFADRNAGTNKTVTVTGLHLTGSQAGDYTLPNPILTANITPLSLTVSGLVASNKVYDGTQTDQISQTGVLNGVLSVDSGGVVLAGYATGTFSDRNVGNGKTVTVSGLSLGGGNAGNYNLTAASLTANITPATLTLSGLTAANKVYDGTTTDSVTGQAVLNGVYAIDNGLIAVSGTQTGTFVNKNVGTSKAVSVGGLNLQGASSGNYVLANTVLTANITPAQLSVSGFSPTNKVYDGTTNDQILGQGSLSGILPIDAGAVSLTGSVSGTFANANAGTAKVVTLSGLSLTGASAADYTFIYSGTLTANIAQAPVTVTGLTATNKVYDGTSTDQINGNGSLTGVLNADLNSVALSGIATGAFVDPHVGTGKTVSVNGLALSGSQAQNYSLSQVLLSANITPKSIQLTGLSANNKTYDATTADTLSGTATLNGVLSADTTTLQVAGTAAGVFSDINAGVNKTVTVVGVSLAGPSANDYSLSLPSLSASIAQAPATISGLTASNRTYDGTTTDAILGAPVINGLAPPDGATVHVGGTAVGAFSDRNAGTNKTVTVTGLSLSGVDSNNYILTIPNLTANILQAPLTISGLTAVNKVYDGTLSDVVNGSAVLTGVVTSDSGAVNLLGTATGAFADRNVGYGKTVNVTGLSIVGPAAGNYSLASVQLAASITPAPISISGLSVNTKVYDTTKAATLSGDATLSGVYAVDQGLVSVGSGPTGVVALYKDPNAGTGKTVTVTGYGLTGASAANYQLSALNLQGDITPASVLVSGLTATNKVYDGSTSDTINGVGALSGQFASDAATLSLVGTASGSFATKNVGTNLTVTISGLSLGGSSAGNYQLTYQPQLASITPKALTLTGLTSAGKTYDGTATAPLSGVATLSGVAGVDGGQVLLSGTAVGAFATPNVALNAPITVSGLSLGGAEAGNYTLGAANVSASITPATLTYTATGASRIFGVTNPTLTGTVTGFVAGETLGSATSGKLDWSTPAGALSSIGVYAINGEGLTANNGNYIFVQAPSNKTAFTVTAPFTAATTGLTVTQNSGGVVTALTGSVDGVETTDLAPDTSTDPSLSNSANQSAPSASHGPIVHATSPANDNIKAPLPLCNKTGGGGLGCGGTVAQKTAPPTAASGR